MEYFEMNPEEYQKLAARTECDQWMALDRMATYRPYEDVHPRQLESKLIPVRANHAAIGIAGEAGELAAAIERWIYYGKPLDVINVKEELGDLFWYMAEMCNALQLDMGDIMAANIAKLRKRYPEKYTDELAAEENRDRAAEREVLEAVVDPTYVDEQASRND
jgi:NTP pyrophosphatase (non-canonical NTP hydrolase)